MYYIGGHSLGVLYSSIGKFIFGTSNPVHIAFIPSERLHCIDIILLYL